MFKKMTKEMRGIKKTEHLFEHKAASVAFIKQNAETRQRRVTLFKSVDPFQDDLGELIKIIKNLRVALRTSMADAEGFSHLHEYLDREYTSWSDLSTALEQRDMKKVREQIPYNRILLKK